MLLICQPHFKLVYIDITVVNEIKAASCHCQEKRPFKKKEPSCIFYPFILDSSSLDLEEDAAIL